MKTLITIAMVLDLDEDDLVEVVQRAEKGMALNILAALDEHGFAFNDLTGAGFEFYGVTATPMRDRVQ